MPKHLKQSHLSCWPRPAGLVDGTGVCLRVQSTQEGKAAEPRLEIHFDIYSNPGKE